MKKIITGMILLCSLCLAACAGKPNNTRPQAWLKPGVKVTLPAPAMVPPVNEQQLLTGSFKGQQQSLLVLLNADEHQLSLAGLSSLGIRLFRITYDEHGIHTEQSIVLPDMPPASQVLADIMLSHWPVSAWRPQLPKGWLLEDRGDQRVLLDADGNVVTEIQYMNRNGRREPISVRQRVFGYHIVIQSLDS